MSNFQLLKYGFNQEVQFRNLINKFLPIIFHDKSNWKPSVDLQKSELCHYMSPLIVECDCWGRISTSRGQNKVYLFERSFLVLIKITLQFNYCNLGFWWCSKSSIWSSSLLQASTISAIKKGQICRKSTFSHLFNIFLRK